MSQPVEAFRNAFKIPELKRRILFTLAMLAIYRLGAHVPAPGVNGDALAEMIERAGQGLLGFYDMFSGGAFSRATLFALGIMPYISASIIMSLLTSVVPALEALQKQGAEGQKKITEYTRYGTIGLCIFQSIGTALYIESMGNNIVQYPGWPFRLMCVISFTTGTAFIMWLGEQISEFGIGNGISMIIFVSIVSSMPGTVIKTLEYIRQGSLNMFQGMGLIIMMCLVVAGTIYITTGQRRIPVQYPRQVKGRKVYGGQRSYLPLRVNQAGVIPIIFASSLMMLPSMLGEMTNLQFIQDWFNPGAGFISVWTLSNSVLIIFFSFFYTAITFNPVEMAENMKKYGGVVMGVRPGKATAEYLNKLMVRITLVGSTFLVAVAALPTLVSEVLEIQDYSVVSLLGGTSLLILVGVALDTAKQMEQHLVMHHYDGFTKGRRMRSRRG